MRMYRLLVIALASIGLLLTGVSTVSAQDDHPKAEKADVTLTIEYSGEPKKKVDDRAGGDKAFKPFTYKPCKLAKHVAKKKKDVKFLANFADHLAAAKKLKKGKARAKATLKARRHCRGYVGAHRKAKKGSEDTPSDEEADAASDAETDVLDEGAEEGEE